MKKKTRYSFTKLTFYIENVFQSYVFATEDWVTFLTILTIIFITFLFLFCYDFFCNGKALIVLQFCLDTAERNADSKLTKGRITETTTSDKKMYNKTTNYVNRTSTGNTENSRITKYLVLIVLSAVFGMVFAAYIIVLIVDRQRKKQLREYRE